MSSGAEDEAARLRARVDAVLQGRLGLAELLSAWPVPLDERRARALVVLEEPPLTDDMVRLVGWMEGESPDCPSPELRRRAALGLLARLGEEYRRREHEAPEQKAWPGSPDDAAVGEAWAALLAPSPSLAAGKALSERYQGVVRASVVGVATVLRLPHAVAADLGGRALEQLDLVFPLARGELAAWVVETGGEPVAALGAALGPGPRRKVAACVESRALWSEVREILPPDLEMRLLSAGTAAAILRRLGGQLAEGRAVPHELGLPGWGVVAANRARVRGRLRVAAAGDVGALRKALLGLDALAARSTAAIAHFAWGWAWREARTGFGFDLDRASAPPCEPGPPLKGRPPPLGEADVPAVRTLLLLVAGRGCWEDLERWIEGAAGRGLDRAFYRCLEAAPDRLADPADPGRRARGYERLRAWLFEGGVEACLPALIDSAARVRPLEPGRDLRARLREALSPEWDESAVAFPQHHLPGFREGLLQFLHAHFDATKT